MTKIIYYTKFAYVLKINKESTTHPLRGIVSDVILLTLGVGKSTLITNQVGHFSPRHLK